MPRRVRTNSSSWVNARKRRNAFETAGCVRFKADAAPETLRCYIKASNTRTRLRSSAVIFAPVMESMLILNFAKGSG